MTFWEAIVLGIVQGLTEFFPVSSSGHLVIIQHLLRDFRQPGIFFDVLLHLGTVLSVIFYFRKNLVKLLQRYLWFIFVATIPAVIVGLIFSDFIEGLFGNIKFVGVALVITSFMNLVTHKVKNTDKKLTILRSAIIGFFQAIAIVPGISRSGSTIFGGAITGIDKKEAAVFSFLLSVPAVLGANFYQLIKYKDFLNGSLITYSFGFMTSLIFGMISIKFVLGFIKKGRFQIFFFYCLILGLIVLFL